MKVQYPPLAHLPASRFPLDIYAAGPPKVERWRPVFNWVLAVPIGLWSGVLQAGSVAVSFVGWFAIMFTGRLPDSWSDYQMATLRYQWRVTAFLFGWTTRYPGFATIAGPVDPGDYPAILYCARAAARNRVSVFFRLILLVPHAVVLCLLYFVVAVVLAAAWFAVLVLGRWPESWRTFAIGYFRWFTRFSAYSMLVTDVWPPFGFRP